MSYPGDVQDGALPSFCWQPPERSYAHFKDDPHYAAAPSHKNPEVMRYQRVDGGAAQAEVLGHCVSPTGERRTTLIYDADHLDPTGGKKTSGVCGGGIYVDPEDSSRLLHVKYDEALNKKGEHRKAATLLAGARSDHSEVGISVLAHTLGIPAVQQHYVSRNGILVGTASNDVAGARPLQNPNGQSPYVDMKLWQNPEHPLGRAWTQKPGAFLGGGVNVGGRVYVGAHRADPEALAKLADHLGVDTDEFGYSFGQHLALSGITQDHDRHVGNYLLSGNKLVGLDFGRGQAPFVKLPDGLPLSSFASRPGDRLTSANYPKALRQSALSRYYSDMAQHALGFYQNSIGSQVRQGFVDTMDGFASLNPNDIRQALGGEPHFWDAERLKANQEQANRITSEEI